MKTKEVYLARVIRANDGWYAIDFPDLPGTHAQCKDLNESEVNELTKQIIAEAVGEEIPAASPTIELKEGEMAAIITADLEAYQRQHDTRSIRKTVSIPMWMANGAEKKGLSLSKVLQDSLKLRLAD